MPIYSGSSIRPRPRPRLFLHSYHHLGVSFLGSNMNKNESASNAPKVPRKIIEKRRRILMKNLSSQLASIIPNQQTMVSTQLDQIDFAIGYIKVLKERIQCMKDNITRISHTGNSHEIITCNISVSIEEKDLASTLELMAIRGLSNNLRLSEVVRVLNEEGLAVMNASFSSIEDNMVFLTVRTQVISARIGVEIPRLRERLNGLVNQSIAKRGFRSVKGIGEEEHIISCTKY